jgi:hypothetical protein
LGVGYLYTEVGESPLLDLRSVESHGQGFAAYCDLAIARSTSLTADIQVIDSPFSSLDTAVVLGLRLKIDF